MNSGITTKIKNALGPEIEKYPAILTVLETMEKLGYHCIYMKKDVLWSYPEQAVHLKKLVLIFVAPIEEKNTLFSIYQDLEKLTQDCTKYSKKLKMDWSSITDTSVAVVMSGVRK